MANIIPPMLIELQLETAKINAQMSQMQTDFKSFGSTVTKQTSALSNFKNMAAGVFTGNLLLGGLQAVKGAITSAIQDAQQYEIVLAKTAAVIKSTGAVAGISVEGLKAHATALEGITAVDENIILNGQNVIATFTNIRNVAGKNNDIFTQTTQAALDLSAALGQDMQSSAIQLGKALNDPVRGVTALQRVGVAFTASQKEMIKSLMNSGDVLGAQKIILAEVNVEFGGAAKAVGDTFAGAIFRAKDKVADFTRNLITGLQPILLNIGKTIGDLYNKFLQPLLSILIKNKEAVALFIGIIAAAVIAFKTYQLVMAAAVAVNSLYVVGMALMKGAKLADVVATDAQTGAMVLLNAVMNMNPIAKVVLAIAALAAGFVVAWNHSETFRKVVIKGMQLVLNAVGYLVGGLATMIGLFAKIPGMGWAKGIADGASNAANKIREVSDGLDRLSNKKIGGNNKSLSISGVLGTTGTIDGNASAPTTVTAENIKAAAAAAKARAKEIEKAKALALKEAIKDAEAKTKEIEKANAEVAKLEKERIADLIGAMEDAQNIYSKMDKTLFESNEKRLGISKDFNSRNEKLKADTLKKIQELTARANEDSSNAEKKAALDRASVIQQSRDLLRNAFAQGAAFDIAQLFKDSDKTGTGLVAAFKTKLESIKNLQLVAGKLSAAGYSQTFIQEIVKQGPQVGGDMANAILEAAPETQSELKSLYLSLEDTSKYGLDALAEQMSTSTKFATKELLNAYNSVGVELSNTLDKINSELSASIFEAEATLQTALMDAQQNFNDAIDALNKDSMDKLKDLQDELKKTADQISTLGSMSAGVSTMAQSPAASYLAGTSVLGQTALTPGQVVINNNTTVTGTNLSDPQATAAAVSNAARFGTPQSINFASKIALMEKRFQ